jgi:hypothetical protein
MADDVFDLATRSVTGPVGAAVLTALRAAIAPAIKAAQCSSGITTASSAATTSVSPWVFGPSMTPQRDFLETMRRSGLSFNTGRYDWALLHGDHAALTTALQAYVPPGLVGRQLGRSCGESHHLLRYVHDVLGLEVRPAVWARTTAYADAHSAGDRWPSKDFVMVSDLPTARYTEHVNGRQRLHNANGPAIQWADGWGAYCWHGAPVPPGLIEAAGAQPKS